MDHREEADSRINGYGSPLCQALVILRCTRRRSLAEKVLPRSSGTLPYSGGEDTLLLAVVQAGP